MTGTLTKATVVRVKVEEGKTGLFYATSPDLRGLLVAEPTIDELEKAIPQSNRRHVRRRRRFSSCDQGRG